MLKLTTINHSTQDPREALIVALKREVSILQQENNHLRQLVELASDSSLNGDSVNQGGLVAQTETNQVVVAGYGHYVDGRGEIIVLVSVRLSGCLWQLQ